MTLDITLVEAVEVLVMLLVEAMLPDLVVTAVAEMVMVDLIQVQMGQDLLELPILVVEQEEVMEVFTVQQLMVEQVDLVLLLFVIQSNK